MYSALIDLLSRWTIKMYVYKCHAKPTAAFPDVASSLKAVLTLHWLHELRWRKAPGSVLHSGLVLWHKAITHFSPEVTRAHSRPWWIESGGRRDGLGSLPGPDCTPAPVSFGWVHVVRSVVLLCIGMYFLLPSSPHKGRIYVSSGDECKVCYVSMELFSVEQW